MKLFPYLQHYSAVQSAAFVCPFDAAQVKICPVNKIPVLSQTEGVRQVVHYDLPLKACRTHDNSFTPDLQLVFNVIIQKSYIYVYIIRFKTWN